MKQEAIAIVGISVFCPAGESVPEFWHNISQGRDFITEAPEGVIESLFFDEESKEIDRFYCSKGGFSNGMKVDPLRYGILPIAAEGIDPDQLSSLAGVDQALQDAGVFEKNISLQRGCVIIGKGNFAGLMALRCMEVIRSANQFAEILRIALPELTDADINRVRHAYQEKQGRFQADTAIGTMPNLVASLVANKFDMQGPAYTIDAACASGIVAINHSIKLLRDGECDIAVAGGMHGAQSAMFWSAFDMMGALSHKEQIAPFSEGADGLLIGQGGGFIVLKTLSKAIEDKDRIYALIQETAVCSDGGGSHVTVTSVQGQVRTLDQAWSKAGMDPSSVGYVEAHGTGTPVGDRTELATLTQFFGDKTKSSAYVGSVKSNIGHTMAAAGMIGVIKTALALYHRTIPPTLHCENPLTAMQDSRFSAPQEAIPWDSETCPLVAGVNAFGFGGINSHAILTAYEPEQDAPAQPSHRPYLGETLVMSAQNKEALIQKIKRGDYTHTGGDYRLVIFDPIDERIGKALSIVEMDKPWHGRLDIWFSNQRLLSKGGKLVYMFPGLNLEQVPEVESLRQSFDLETFEDFQALIGVEMTEATDELTAHGLQLSYGQWINKRAFEKIGLEADMYIGHSIGEWSAADWAGITEGGIWDTIRPDAYFDESDKSPYVVVSGMDAETAEAWCAEIPELYLSNDNCPEQILLCGKPEATEILVARLEEEQYFYTVLPYGLGYHTPLIANKVKFLTQFLENATVREGSVPVWSASTLELVPTERDAYVELVESQLLKPVYFRGLIEKLYKEQDARVFIQIGLGSLVAFVEGTLKGCAFGSVACNTTTRSGADQMRRVLALLFVEGREVDADFLGVKLMYQVDHSLMTLPTGALLLPDLPELSEVVSEHYGAGGADLSAFFGKEAAGSSPLLQMASDNLREAVQVQEELRQAFSQVPEVEKQASRHPQPTTFEEILHLNYEDHPYLVDHSIIRQPAGWAYGEDLNPIVPFTMTIELLAEIAQKYIPDKKLISIGSIMAYQWIAVESPFEGTVKGTWKGPDVIELEIVGYAKAQFRFGSEWLDPPAKYVGDIDTGKDIIFGRSAADLYDSYAFHGPQYHSNVEQLNISERGIRNMTRKKAGKGSLLDIMGQQLGLFLHLTETENTISFPVRLKNLSFYGDIFDQEGLFEHTIVVTRLDDHAIAGDMILKREGRIWAVAQDFVCQRFENDIPVWMVMLKPQTHKLAREIAPAVYEYTTTGRNNVVALLEKRYLNVLDKKEYAELKTVDRKREFLFSRIALKDAIRDFVAQDGAEMLYPVEIFCVHDENGKPLVYGEGDAAQQLEGLCVSIAHKGNRAVAMVGTSPVGVDLEKIEERTEGFIAGSFTAAERSVLGAEPSAELVTRCWVAKEACAKKTGRGLQGDPKRFEIQAIEGEVLILGKERVQTTLVGDEYVAGWTL